MLSKASFDDLQGAKGRGDLISWVVFLCYQKPPSNWWQDAVWCVDVGASKSRTGQAVPEKSFTLTRSRSRTGVYMILPHRRFMTLHEVEALQGFPEGHLRIPAGVSPKQYAAMLGNAFTVSVVGRVSLHLLKVIGKIPWNYPDPWATEAVTKGFDFSRFNNKKQAKKRSHQDTMTEGTADY